LAVADRLQLQVELKDIDDTSLYAELEDRMGIVSVPYLVDEAAGIEMSDSDVIVAHLQTTYGQKSTVMVRPRVSISDNVCVACEG
jgi:glutathione S-transferase